MAEDTEKIWFTIKQYSKSKYLMLRESLLIIWMGTTTNFTVIDHYWSREHCELERQRLEQQINDKRFSVECREDMREGRSTLPPRQQFKGVAP